MLTFFAEHKFSQMWPSSSLTISSSQHPLSKEEKQHDMWKKYFVSFAMTYNYRLKWSLSQKKVSGYFWTHKQIFWWFVEKTFSIMKAELDEWSPSFEQTSLKCRSTFVSTMTLTSTTSKSLLTSMSRLYVDSHSRWPKYTFYRQDRLRRQSTLRIDASNVLRRQELSRCRHCFLAKEVPLFDSVVGGIWNIDKTDIETVSWLRQKSFNVNSFLIKKSFN